MCNFTRFTLILCLGVVFLFTSACGAVRSVRLAAGYGPFSAEIEVLLRNADAAEAQNGPDCPAAAEMRARARALGAVELPASE